jgi:demethylmenaquinone methyltransferase/2-methoxy-6-polyprenyl-1,4-benzoquinol methylase
MADLKAEFVRTVFAEVPATYERVNHILTLGFDTIWRRAAAKKAARARGGCWADVCAGTGESATYLRQLAPPQTAVYAVDFSLPMLAEAGKKRSALHIRRVCAEAMRLPFPDESLDLVVMSFATRNINRSRQSMAGTFAEYYRVLRPGGRFVNLETSRPARRAVRACVDLYVRLIVRRIGARISGSRRAYAYLANTIPRFYPPEELADILRAAGFAQVRFERKLFGVAAIHVCVKL